MAPTISKVQPSLQEASSRNAGLVAGATLAKKWQKIVKTEVYKVSDNRRMPICSRASQAAVRAGKGGAGDRAMGSPVPTAILCQYDTSDNDMDDKGADDDESYDNNVASDGQLDDRGREPIIAGGGPSQEGTKRKGVIPLLPQPHESTRVCQRGPQRRGRHR
jgi:hypothetical protein